MIKEGERNNTNNDQKESFVDTSYRNHLEPMEESITAITDISDFVDSSSVS